MVLFLELSAVNIAVAQPRHSGVFAVGIGAADDGCSFRWQTRMAVPGWQKPTTEAGRPIRRIEPNRLIEPNDHSEALTVTLKLGVAVARQDMSLEAVDYGSRSYLSQNDYYESGRTVILNLRQGDEIQLLARGPEGSQFFKAGSQVYTGYLPNSLETVQAPETQLWVKLIPRDNQPAAWVLVSDSNQLESLPCELIGWEF
ncbi:MAG: hypothetical protein HC835_21755 [Oscillatoriales cyanobacterium RM2_1_1]|nr:hypothetical protein [Oscillatoriales cyanobacterium RM2_1_1]